ncbi:MAG: CvpA family protein [Clostridia bacterium]|nr:CvpA family protein [Clostridia bacterium]
MNIALDIITAVIFLGTVIASWRRGFVRAVLGIVSLIAAFVVSKAYYQTFAAWIDEKFMHNKVTEMLNGLVSSNEQAESVKISFDTFIANIKSLVPGLSQTVSDGSGAVQGAVDTITERISYSFSEVAAIILIFLAVLVVCRIIIAIIDAIFKLPGLGAINHGLGLIVGIIKGVFFVFLFCILVAFIGMMMAASPEPLITREVINETYIFKIFYYNNVITNSMF